MRLLVRHGHFAFYPENASEISLYVQYFGVQLIREGYFYTYAGLVGAPRYSIAGLPYLNLTANTTYEGRGPWDVMRENGFVATAATGVLVPKASISIAVNPPRTGFFFLAESPLIQPGSRNAAGQQLLSYDAEFRQDLMQLRVSEFRYE